MKSKGYGERKDLIFYFESGTFDGSLILIDKRIFEVEIATGDALIDGEDFVSKMVEFWTVILRESQEWI